MRALGRLFTSSKQGDNSDTHVDSASANRSNANTSEDLEMVVVIEENERFSSQFKAWSHEYLLDDDPLRFKSSAGPSRYFPSPPLANGWEWTGEWELEKLSSLDGHAEISSSDSPQTEWVYAMNFGELDSGLVSLQPFSRSKGQYQVRRKRWTRSVRPTDPSIMRQYINNDNKYSPSNSRRGSKGLDLGPRVDSEDANDGEDTESVSQADTSSIMGGLDAKFEIEEEDEIETSSIADTEADTDRTRRGLLFTRTTSQTAAKPIQSEFTIRVRDPTLVSIGKQLKSIEGEIKAIEDSDNADWQKYHKPTLEIQIRELDKYCASIKARMEAEMHKGLEHVTFLEDELKQYSSRLEEAKKKFYFPTSAIAIGQGGIYVALDDFWLENTSGHFDIELIPSKDRPQVKIVITGSKNSTHGGISIRLRVDGLKLAGDKGKRIPKIKMEAMKVLASLRINIVIDYDVASSKWMISNPKNFKLELLSFKGPYGITQSVVGAIISVITPALRTKIVAALPPELGLLMRTLPSPFSCRGEFDITGPELIVLSTHFEKSAVLCRMFEYTPSQMDMFQWLQKSMERPKPLRTMTDLLVYIRSFKKHKEKWTTVISLWNQAAKIYSEKVTTIRYEQINSQASQSQHQPIDPTQTTITFNSFLTIAEDFRKKRLGAYFKLQYLDGQLSVNQMLKFGHKLLHRTTSEKSAKASGAIQARLMLMLDRIQHNYEQGLEMIKMVSRNIDYAELKLRALLNAGPQGKLQMTVSDIHAQLPLVLDFALTKEKNLGHAPLVPYIISIKPRENGDLFIEIYHFSKEGLEASRRGDYKTRGIGDRRRSTFSNILSSSPPEEKEDVNRDNSDAISTSGGVTHVDLSNISSFAQSSIQTIKKGVTQVTQSIQEGITRMETSASHSRGSLSPYGDRRSVTTGGFTNGMKRNKALEQTLQQMPQGEIADTILITTISRPYISMIVDKQMTLKPGTEIFSLLVGPRDNEWRPFGSELHASLVKDSDSQPKDPLSSHLKETSPPSTPSEGFKKPSELISGCPVLIHTSPGIKLMNKIPKAEVTLNLPGLVRFIGSHFEDIDLLKGFIEKFAGSEVYEEQLNVFKLILDRFAKYLLLPGLNIEININGKLVALNDEIKISIETPNFSTQEMPSNFQQPIMSSAERRGSSILWDRTHEKNEDCAHCALILKAELNLIDIVEDSLAVEQSLKSIE